MNNSNQEIVHKLEATCQKSEFWSKTDYAVKLSANKYLSFQCSSKTVYVKIWTTEKKKFNYFLNELHLLKENRDQIFIKFILKQRHDVYKLRIAPSLDICRGQVLPYALGRVDPQTNCLIQDSCMSLTAAEYEKLQAFLAYINPAIKEILMKKKPADRSHDNAWFYQNGPSVKLRWSELSFMWDISQQVR